MHRKKIFTFTCPPDKVTAARRILSSFDGVKVFTHRENTVSVTESEDNKTVLNTGVEISAVCSDELTKYIIEALAKAKIAGYSRETLIIFRDAEYRRITDTVQ